MKALKNTHLFRKCIFLQKRDLNIQYQFFSFSWGHIVEMHTSQKSALPGQNKNEPKRRSYVTVKLIFWAKSSKSPITPVIAAGLCLDKLIVHQVWLKARCHKNPARKPSRFLIIIYPVNKRLILGAATPS